MNNQNDIKKMAIAIARALKKLNVIRKKKGNHNARNMFAKVSTIILGIGGPIAGIVLAPFTGGATLLGIIPCLFGAAGTSRLEKNEKRKFGSLYMEEWIYYYYPHYLMDTKIREDAESKYKTMLKIEKEFVVGLKWNTFKDTEYTDGLGVYRKYTQCTNEISSKVYRKDLYAKNNIPSKPINVDLSITWEIDGNSIH